ncbi:MAG: restriction endonuclease [Hellea sp.]|nr:restriction endonuclease [Hellea sp.]
MSDLSPFRLKGRNPDVLSCIANLSNDEVFTPPEFANRMLDTLAQGWATSHNGANIWTDSSVTFLDPCTKSGVFLREITARLIKGLEAEIPDLQTRVDHILTRQVFGIGITQLTALLARRSLYCSKQATGEHSVASAFENDDGNIWFKRTEHEWHRGKCVFCGAAAGTLDRGEDAETHAYAFIHTANIQGRMAEIFGDDMQFDVIIGNPPYQLSDGGHGTSARPIFQEFVNQAKMLNPRFLTMVIPARWYSGGKGMDGFRTEMLNDQRLREIHDCPDASDWFPSVQIKGGVCYFLWNRENLGDCKVSTYSGGNNVSQMTRPLLEQGCETFIRYNEAISVLHKVMELEESPYKAMVSSRKPFGLPTTFKGANKPFSGGLKMYQNGGVGYVADSNIESNRELIPKHKVFIPPLGSGSDSFPHPILGKPIYGEPDSVCTETYLVAGAFDSKSECISLISYLRTKFLRFLVLLNKPTQHATSKVYQFVPMQDWSKTWTDEELYKKYGLTEDEIAFIESMVRPMELDLFDQPAAG